MNEIQPKRCCAAKPVIDGYGFTTGDAWFVECRFCLKRTALYQATENLSGTYRATLAWNAGHASVGEKLSVL